MNRKDSKNFDYKKLRLIDDYQYESENEEEQQTSKKFNKKKSPKKLTKTDVDELNELIMKEETGIDSKLFKNYFNFERPTALLKALYNLNDKNKNKRLVDVIESGLSDFKNKIEKMSEDEIRDEKSYEMK